MLRSVKYGLYGAVLAGVVGGSVAWTKVDKTVTLVVDGQRSTAHTTASTVSDVLAQAGFRVGPRDLVAPGSNTTVHGGETIVLGRARLLRLDVNGASRDVWTTAPTVAAALDLLGYTPAAYTSVSRAERLPLTPTDIEVRTPRSVTVVYDGAKHEVSTTDASVSQLLDDLGVALGPADTVSVPQDSAPLAGQTIVVHRTVRSVQTLTQSIAFATKTTADPKLAAGQTVVVTPGAAGVAQVTYVIVRTDGRIVSKKVVKTVVVTGPTAQVQRMGTKQVAVMTPAQAQAIAKALLKARGWGDDQWNCLGLLWGHESGWRVNAANPNTGAYGIPQALPGSKMGPGWQTDARVQITWGLNYIHDRFGTPCGAWATWQATGWY